MPSKGKAAAGAKRATAPATLERGGLSAISAQDVADVLALACCAATANDRLPACFAVIGALTAPLAVAFVPLLLMGAASSAALAVVSAHLLAALLRCTASFDRPLDRADSSRLHQLAGAFVFVPEAVYGWAMRRGEAWSIELWRGADGSSLHAGALPSPKNVRSMAAAKARGTTSIVVVNTCRWWAGWQEAYSSLGVEHVYLPAASVDILETVATLRRRQQPDRAAASGGGGRGEAGGGGGGDGGGGGGGGVGGETGRLQVHVHCESGAYSLCVAAAFLCLSDDSLDAGTAAARVCSAARGRLSASEREVV